MRMFGKFSELELDIVGIVAILGEGSTSRNAQASALSWFHVLPRLYPAPQALLKHNQEKRLPVEPGIVVGALSGRIRNELNFFTQLLHNQELDDYAVELVQVSRKENNGKPDFGVQKFGHLAALAVLGSCMSVTLFALSVWQSDGPALLAMLFLSATSSFVGLASWCNLDKTSEIPNPDRRDTTPLGDVVIFYPRNGAFRIVRCDDEISRLYFKVENCEHFFGDNMYRTISLFSTVLLMGGLIMLSNARSIMQMSFAASYILLNALYWMSSALDPAKHVWKHNFVIKPFGIAKRTEDASNISATAQIRSAGPAANTIAQSLHVDPIAASAHQYYPNGIWQASWNERRANRVPTKLVILRNDDPQPQVSIETVWSQFQRHSARFISFAFNIPIIKVSPGTPQAQDFSPAQGIQQAHNAQNTAGQMPFSLPSKKSEKPNLTTALWTVIALTGSARWARSTNIAPNNPAWDQWLDEAEKRATVRWSEGRGSYVPPCTKTEHNGKTWIHLPHWSYQTRLSDIFKEQSETTRNRYDMQAALEGFDARLDGLQCSLGAVIALRIMCRRYRRRKRQAAAQATS